jgi:hypothetical protein
VEDYDTGVEFTYHTRSECQMKGVEETAKRSVGGKILIMHHYHVCGDEQNGFNCRGGCFAVGLS